MKHFLLPCLTLLLLSACTKNADDAVPAKPEYTDTADWYVLRAPDNRAIEAVAGEVDGTLTITTMFHIYQTQDRGKTWQVSDYAASRGIVGFGVAQDTLLALTMGMHIGAPTDQTYATQPSFASLDQGATWVPYRDRRRGNGELRVCRNQVTAPSGTEYRIEYLLTPKTPTSTSHYVETIGIRTSTGRQLTLPQSHTLTSLSFDAQARLYVTASGALCGQREQYAYCGSSNGVLYVSKKAQQ